LGAIAARDDKLLMFVGVNSAEAHRQIVHDKDSKFKKTTDKVPLSDYVDGYFGKYKKTKPVVLHDPKPTSTTSGYTDGYFGVYPKHDLVVEQEHEAYDKFSKAKPKSLKGKLQRLAVKTSGLDAGKFPKPENFSNPNLELMLQRQRPKMGPKRKPRIRRVRRKQQNLPVALPRPRRQRFSNVSVAAAYGGSFNSPSDAIQTTRIRKCEYLSDIRPTVSTFQLLTFAINPAVATTFPWLSSIAGSWEYYQMNALRFIYKPNCASTSVGTVAMAVEYDTGDLLPLNKVQLSEYKPYISGSPWAPDIIYNAPKRFLNLHNNGKLLTRQGSTTATNLTDVGVLYFASQDVVAGYLGELYIEYDVTLINQQNSANVITGDLSATMAALVPFNSAKTIVQGTASGISFGGTTDSIFIPYVGSFLFDISITGAANLASVTLAATGTGAIASLIQATIITTGLDASHTTYLVTCGAVDQLSPPKFTVTLTGSSAAGTIKIRIGAAAFGFT